MRRKAGETWRCEACNEALIGARTRKGEVAPIEYNVKPDGNVLLFRAAGANDKPLVECRTFAGDTLEKLKSETVPLRRNHFAACSDAERFAREQAG